MTSCRALLQKDARDVIHTAECENLDLNAVHDSGEKVTVTKYSGASVSATSKEVFPNSPNEGCVENKFHRAANGSNIRHLGEKYVAFNTGRGSIQSVSRRCTQSIGISEPEM